MIDLDAIRLRAIARAMLQRESGPRPEPEKEKPAGRRALDQREVRNVSAILDQAMNRCDPVTRWMDIGPDQAAEMLKRNTVNRPKKQQKIKMYAGDIKRGAWPVTGNPIQFGKGGHLLDGQNRLQAIIDSGATLRMLVIEGIDDDVFDVIDRGAGRTSTDVLVVLGYSGWVAATGAAAAPIAFSLSRGAMPYSHILTPAAVREFVSEHRGLMQSVQFVELRPRVLAPMTHSAASALHFLMAKKSALMADTYMQQLFVGNDMRADDMVLRLRNSLLQRGKTTSGRGAVKDGIGAAIKVWNALRAGRNIAHINNAFPRSDEAFPEIK